MPIVVKEAVNSRRFSENRKGARLERIFWVHGTDDPDAAVAADGVPRIDESYGILGNLFVASREVEVHRATGDEAEGLCQVSVSYESPEHATPPPDGETEFELSTLAQTEHVVRALAQTHFPGSADVGDLIGVNGDAVEGVDIYVPKVAYREIHERTTLTKGYRRTLSELTAKVNDAPFKGWNAGEVLFLGATARRRGADPWRIDFSFAVEPNRILVVETVSGAVNAPKNGWDYIWFAQARIASNNDTEIAHRIESAHVAQVYEYGNFSKLGIGT